MLKRTTQIVKEEGYLSLIRAFCRYLYHRALAFTSFVGVLGISLFRRKFINKINSLKDLNEIIDF
ncbi:MAG: hypothetical protein ACP5IT_10875, partial [Thermoproteota archaeon]